MHHKEKVKYLLKKVTFLNNIKKHSNADKFNLKFIQKT